jgi:hypothetical protein
MSTTTHTTASDRDKRARRRIQREVMYLDIQELLEYRLLHQPQNEHAYCHHLARQEQRAIDRTQYRWHSVGIDFTGCLNSRPFTRAHLAHPPPPAVGPALHVPIPAQIGPPPPRPALALAFSSTSGWVTGSRPARPSPPGWHPPAGWTPTTARTPPRRNPRRSL